MLQKKNSKDTETRVEKEGQLETALEALNAAQYRTILHMLDTVVNDNTTFDTDQLKGSGWDTKVFAPLLAAADKDEAKAQALLEDILMDYLIHRPDKTWSYHHEHRDQLGRSKRAVIFEVEKVTPA